LDKPYGRRTDTWLSDEISTPFRSGPWLVNVRQFSWSYDVPTISGRVRGSGPLNAYLPILPLCYFLCTPPHISLALLGPWSFFFPRYYVSPLDPSGPVDTFSVRGVLLFISFTCRYATSPVPLIASVSHTPSFFFPPWRPPGFLLCGGGSLLH